MDLVVEVTIVCFGLFLAFIVWARPEYGLVAYGLALGFPDLALPVGPTVNVRSDDLLMALLLPRVIFWHTAQLAPRQSRILFWATLFFVFCCSSAVVGVGVSRPPETSDVLRLMGCGVVLLVLPTLMQSWRCLRLMLTGCRLATRSSGGVLVLFCVFVDLVWPLRLRL